MVPLPIPESYWVEDNRFLAGEYPGGHHPETTRRRLDVFLKAGVNTFIDLTQPHELVPYEPILKELAGQFDIKAVHYRFAIRDHGIPSRETMTAILNTIDNAMENDKSVYVHCWGGVGRTGIVVACYLIRHGMAPQKALERVHQLFKTRPQNYYSTSPETDRQFEFVRTWREIPKPSHRSKQNFCEG